jgi:serine/threonine-protein kinase
VQAPGCAFQRKLAGTLRYMAPEWLVKDSSADATSDIYSLGAVLYEALSGAPPFAYEQPRRLAAAHLEEVPTNLRELRPELPGELCDLVHRMLAKEKLRRPATASELASQLCRLETSALAEAWASRAA